MALKSAEGELLTQRGMSHLSARSFSSSSTAEVEAVEVEALPATVTGRTGGLGDHLDSFLAGLQVGCLTHLLGSTLELDRDRSLLPDCASGCGQKVFMCTVLHLLLLTGEVDITFFFYASSRA